MKIVHIIDYFQPRVGYQETFLAREYAKLGHEVTVVTSDFYYPFPHYAQTYGKVLGKRRQPAGRRIEGKIIVDRLKSIHIPGSPLMYMSGLEENIYSLQPDVVYCHGMYSITAYRIAALKEKLGFKLLYDTHAARFNTNFNSTLPKKIYIRIWKSLAVPKLLKAKDAIFAVGEDEQSLLAENYGIPAYDIPIIRLGVDQTLFRLNVNAGKRIRKKMNIPKRDAVVIYTGKVSPEKDADILIEAINILKDKHLHLLIVGSGREEYLEMMVQRFWNRKNIHMQKPVDISVLPDFFSAADFAVWPGNPTISIAEALSCGLPVILPEFYGTNYLDASGAIMRFDRRNTRQLSEKIKKLAYNRNLVKTMGKKARVFAVTNLSWTSIARQTLDLLK